MKLYEFTYTDTGSKQNVTDVINTVTKNLKFAPESQTWHNWEVQSVDMYERLNGETIWWLEVHGEEIESVNMWEPLCRRETIAKVFNLIRNGDPKFQLNLKKFMISEMNCTIASEFHLIGRVVPSFTLILPYGLHDKFILKGIIKPEDIEIMQDFSEPEDEN